MSPFPKSIPPYFESSLLSNSPVFSLLNLSELFIQSGNTTESSDGHTVTLNKPTSILKSESSTPSVIVPFIQTYSSVSFLHGLLVSAPQENISSGVSQVPIGSSSANPSGTTMKYILKISDALFA